MKNIVVFLFGILLLNYANAQKWIPLMDSAMQQKKQRAFSKSIYFDHLAQAALPADSSISLTYIEIASRLGENNLRLSKYDSAEKYLLQAMDIFKSMSITHHPLYAVLCDRLGQLYEVTVPEKAASYYYQSNIITKEIFKDTSIEYAQSCNSLGNFYFNAGQFEQAVEMHLKAKRIKEIKLSKNDPDYARTCNNLGAAYREMGEYEKAEPLILEAYQIRALIEPVKASPVYAVTCTNLANIYTTLGQFDKAEKLYLEAKAIRAYFEPIKQHPDYAASCNILADFYAGIKSFDKAEVLYKEAIQIRKNIAGEGSLDYAESCNNLAMLYTDIGKLTDAELLALKAKNIWDTLAPTDSPEHAINRNNLALLYVAMEKYPLALYYFNEARKLWKKNLGQGHTYYIDNTANIAKVYRATQQYDTANQFYIEALKAQREQVNKIFRFTSESEKNDYIKSSNNFTDEFLSFYYRDFAMNKASAIYDRLLLNRNLILSSSIQLRKTIHENNDPLLKNQYDEWIDIKRKLATEYGSNETVDSDSLNVWEQKANDLEKRLTLESSDFKAAQLIPDWRMLKEQLNKDEAAIEFTSFKYYNAKHQTDSVIYAAILIKKEMDEPVMIPLFEKKQLDSIWQKKELLPDINNLYGRGQKGIKILKKTKPLYDLIWKPIENEISGIKKIFFAPAGDLFKISFAALSISDKQLLSDKYELVQLNSTASVVEKSEDNQLKKRDSIYLYGGIFYNADTGALKKVIRQYHPNEIGSVKKQQIVKSGKQFSYLPGTLKEVMHIQEKAIASGYKTKLMTGNDAVEESFNKMSELYGAAVIHIATHGFFDEKDFDASMSKGKSNNPLLRCGLLFAGAQQYLNGFALPGNEDGISTGLEISNLYFPHTKLVVLSACETALGDIHADEGVYGLQRAFKIAGAQYLLMSLWQVGDLETAAFMQSFYDGLFLNLPIEKAFLLAQTKMKILYIDKPEKWAAWILVR